jgi:hypothetical protein
MSILRVEIPRASFESIRGAFVLVAMNTTQPYSVVCVADQVSSALPTTIEFDAVYGYASVSQVSLQNWTLVEIALSYPLAPRRRICFNGTSFTAAGGSAEGYLYAMQNESGLTLTSGLARKISVNGEAALQPVNIQHLAPHATTQFLGDDAYSIGLAWVAEGVRAGQVLQTSLFGTRATLRALMRQPQSFTLSPFVSFTLVSNTVATYQASEGRFSVKES